MIIKKIRVSSPIKDALLLCLSGNLIMIFCVDFFSPFYHDFDSIMAFFLLYL